MLSAQTQSNEICTGTCDKFSDQKKETLIFLMSVASYMIYFCISWYIFRQGQTSPGLFRYELTIMIMQYPNSSELYHMYFVYTYWVTASTQWE